MHNPVCGASIALSHALFVPLPGEKCGVLFANPSAYALLSLVKLITFPLASSSPHQDFAGSGNSLNTKANALLNVQHVRILKHFRKATFCNVYLLLRTTATVPCEMGWGHIFTSVCVSALPMRNHHVLSCPRIPLDIREIMM